MNAPERSDDDGRCARGSAEPIRIPEIPIGAALEIPVARRRHFTAPALRIDRKPIVRESEPRPIGAMIATMCARRWSAGAHQDRTGIARPPAEWILPARREAGGPAVVYGIIEILGSVSGSLYDDHAASHGVANGVVDVRPELHRDVTALIRSRHEVEAGPRRVKLYQNDVPRPGHVGGLPYRTGGAETTEDGDSTHDGVRTNTGHSERVPVTSELPNHRRSMILPAEIRGRGPTDDAALILTQVLVSEPPCPFYVGDAHTKAHATWLRPCISSIDASRRRIEVTLS